MKIIFFSNLQIVQADILELNKTEPSLIPSKGDLVQIEAGPLYCLEVRSVTHSYKRQETLVELGIASSERYVSAAEWEEWFRNYRYPKTPELNSSGVGEAAGPGPELFKVIPIKRD